MPSLPELGLIQSGHSEDKLLQLSKAAEKQGATAGIQYVPTASFHGWTLTATREVQAKVQCPSG